MKKIVYLDVDGTLLNKAGQLSELNKKVIKEIQAKGIYVAFATGRNFLEIQDLAAELELDKNLNYAICENGAYVTRTDQFVPHQTNLIKLEDAKELLSFFNKKDILTLFSTLSNQGVHYTNFDIQDETVDQDLSLPQMKLTPIDESFHWKEVSMIAFECPKDQTDSVESYLIKNFPEINFVVSRSAHRIKPLFMLNAKATSKATSILKLNEELGISPENTYFFGDGLNDVEAIQTFTNSYVPLSAPDDIKAIAKNIIGSASEDGVGLKLQELFLS